MGFDREAESEEILVCGRLDESNDRVRPGAELRWRPAHAARGAGAARPALVPA